MEEGSSTEGTTNEELEEICKNIPYFKGVFCRDELKKMKPNENESMIVFTNTTKSKGIAHWQAIHKRGDYKVFFCSYGSPPSDDIKNYLGKHILTSNLRIQENDSNCGYWCVLILYLLSQGFNFESIILDLNEQYRNRS